MEAMWIDRKEVKKLFKAKLLHKGNHAKLDGMTIVVQGSEIGITRSWNKKEVIADALLAYFKLQVRRWKNERNTEAGFREFFRAIGASKKQAFALVALLKQIMAEDEGSTEYSQAEIDKHIMTALDI
jgi:hypothetical protein